MSILRALLWLGFVSFSSAAEEELYSQQSLPTLTPTIYYTARQNKILEDLGFLPESLTHFHIYQCSFPEKTIKPLLFLGTYHGLPHNIFPKNVWTMLLDQEELYVEQKNGPILRFDESAHDYIDALTDQQKDMGKDFLSFLGHDSQDLCKLRLESLVQVFYRFHNLFGMDMQILMDYTTMNKPIFQLDGERLSYTSLEEWIQDAKEVISEGLKDETLQPEEALDLTTELQTIDAKPFPVLLRHYIQPTGTKEYMKFFSQYVQKEYIQKNDISADSADEQRSLSMMNERNEGWINIIQNSLDQNPLISKMFAFGIAHMYEILYALQQKGGMIERLQSDGDFTPYTLQNQ